MKYATAALAAVLLCSGAATAQSLSGVGQYHKDRSNMQNTSDTKPSASTDASVNAKANAGDTACQAGAAGSQDAAAQAANATAQGNAQCSTTNPPAAAPQTQPAPQ